MTFFHSQQNASPLQLLSRSLGQGIGGGLQSKLTQNLEMRKKTLTQQLEEAQQMRNRERKQAELQNFLQSEAANDLNPLERLIIEGVSKELFPAATGKSIMEERRRHETPEITPYQHELIDHRRAQLDLQQQKLAQAKEKGSQQIPQMIAAYTKNYTEGLNVKPTEKLEFDNYVQNAWNSGLDLKDSLSQAVEKLNQKKEALKVKIPSPPFGAGLRGEAKQKAMQEAVGMLKTARDAGANDKQLRGLAQKAGWKKEDIEQMLRAVESPEQEEAMTTAPNAPTISQKVPFDRNNPEHVARAQQVLQETGGDRNKANEILSHEFTK